MPDLRHRVDLRLERHPDQRVARERHANTGLRRMPRLALGPERTRARSTGQQNSNLRVRGETPNTDVGARMWYEVTALGAVIAAILVVGSRPMTISVQKLDAIGPSAHRVDTIATIAATSIVTIILLAILGLVLWLVRIIIRRGTRQT